MNRKNIMPPSPCSGQLGSILQFVATAGKQGAHKLAELLKLYDTCRHSQHPQASAYTLMLRIMLRKPCT